MDFFAVPYQIHFDDTMAYGSHHFLTNFKFQCAGREHLLFDPRFFEDAAFRHAFDQVLLLTHEAYSRNLAPAMLGERLVVLTTLEERGEVSVRFCFRTLKRDGTPVACGFQSILCADRTTGNIVPFPDAFRRCFEQLAGIHQPDTTPSFRDRVLRGGRMTSALFDDAVKRLASTLLATPEALAGPRVVTLDEPRSAPALVLPAGSTAFLFAGQGTFESELFLRLKALQPELRGELAAVTATCARFGIDTAPLFDAPDHASVLRALAATPSLDQLGIFLSGVLGARWLRLHHGVQPDVFVGHSFGEIAAMTAAGALDLHTGAEVVCRRIRALELVPDDAGTLAAIALDIDETARAIADSGAHGLAIAGRNHARQTVVAGPHRELTRLRTQLEGRGQGFTAVPSRYPFHHPKAMAPAVDAFRTSLSVIAAGPAQGPIYSPIAQQVYAGGRDELADALARHLVTPFDFLTAVETLARAGCTRFVDCGTNGRLSRMVERILGTGARYETETIDAALPAVTPAVEAAPVAPAGTAPGTLRPATLATTPVDMADAIAVVSLGCILPGGANDPETYWQNIRRSVSGIVDHGEIEAHLDTDFVGPAGTPDRTYTLLTGRVRDTDLIAPPGLDPVRFAGYIRVQKLLAIALSQAVAALGVSARAPSRVQCMLGSTADGSYEYDIALCAEAGDALMRSRGAYDPALARATRSVFGVTGSSDELAPHATLQAVVTDVVGPGVATMLLDAACASSLYTIALGAKALELRDADLVLAGGVFSAGPGNNCLFSQFNGLSATGSRPFDERADGVIFGEGAGVVGLMRLSDAVAAGLTVRAVIRAVGLSSDGRSSSANVPRSDGQVAAMEACYARSGLDPATIQYIEAHGTATPAGDATELKSIGRMFRGKRQGIEIGSVKALIGHVGWAAGAASVIKLCKALEHRTIPPQSNFERAGAELRALGPDFEVSTREHPWSDNGMHPRRAATSGFGFGGTNAHLVLEEYRGSRPAVHHDAGTIAAGTADLVLVAAEGVFPDAHGSPVVGVPDAMGTAFDPRAVRLPAGLRLLPDIAEDMDVTQTLSLIAASALVEQLGGFDTLRAKTALVIALQGKTRRGVEAMQRVLAFSTRRRLRPLAANPTDTMRSNGATQRAEALYEATLASTRPSGPYTLQGMMPNVTPGRVAGALDLKGPNFVIDAGANSLAAALRSARLLLASGFDLVLVGSVHIRLPGDVPASESAMMVALTTQDHAARLNLTPRCVLGTRSNAQPGTAPRIDLPPHSTAESLAVLHAVRGAMQGHATFLSFFPEATSGARLALAIESVSRVMPAAAVATTRPATPATPPVAPSTAPEPVSGFEHTAPVLYHAPRLVERAARPPARSQVRGRRVLFVAQDEALARELVSYADSLCGPVHGVLFVGPSRTEGRLHAIDLVTDETAQAGFDALGFAPEIIVAVCRLDASASEADAVADTAMRHDALELLFLAARRVYDDLAAGTVQVASLCVGGLSARRTLHPITGLFAGMLKSLGREVPERNVRAISTSPRTLSAALDLLETEIGAEEAGSTSIEVCFDGPTRYVRRLQPIERAAGPAPLLDAGSVVLLTGGGRGVTAVLAEGLLKRYRCRVVLVGRSDVNHVPEHILNAREADLPQVEREFYAAERAREPATKMPVLRQRFERLLAARELHGTLEALGRLPGHYVYRTADVTRRSDVDRVVDEVVGMYGRIDLVVHGAGTQTSKRFDRRRLAELRTNLDTKLRGVWNLREACVRRLDRPVPFHVLTSAFSFIGNDGQADYGAANEALDRMCAWVSGARGEVAWSSADWLAWDGVGMTRGSEYRVLGATRQLRGIRAPEGEALFLQLFDGRPAEPINVQLTENERSFYGLEILPIDPRPVRGAPLQREVVIDAASVPCLDDHLVRGTPTLPGAWALDIMLQHALGDQRPELRTVQVEDARFSRFIRVKPGRRQTLRVEWTTVVNTPDRLSVEARLVGDTVHASGVVLERDVRYAEANFTLMGEPPSSTPQLEAATLAGKGLHAHDPHCAPGAPIALGRMFDCLLDIQLEPTARSARLHVAAGTPAGQAIPALVLDAAWRLSTMHVHGVSNAVFAPVELKRATFDRGLVSAWGTTSCRLALKALAPRIDGDIVRCGSVAIRDESGRLRMTIEGALARPIDPSTVHSA